MAKTIFNDKGEPFSKWQPADKFAYKWREFGPAGSEPVSEYEFDAERKWRWDFCWPSLKVAVEIDGFGPGHQAIHALSNNHEKQNAGVEQGWRVLRFTSRQLGSYDSIADAVDQVLRVIVAATLTEQDNEG